MKYAIIEDGVVVNIVVSDDPDFAEEQGWVPAEEVKASIGWEHDGKDFVEKEPKRPVPIAVSPMRAKLALYKMGLYDQVETLIKSSPAPVQIAWANAIEFRRDDPFVLQVGAALRLSSDEIDELFRVAFTLTTG